MRPVADPVLAALVDDLSAFSAFGVSGQITLATGGLLVAGTLIPEHEYFEHLGARFRENAERERGEQLRGGPSEREKEQGWTEDRVRYLGFDQQRTYELYGEHAQEVVRRRILDRPESNRVNILNKEERRGGRHQAAQLLGDDAEPRRAYVHLKDVTILGAGPEPVRSPFWRVRLSDVSGWDFGSVGR